MTSIANRIQKREERIIGVEDTIEDSDNSQRKCNIQKGPNPKHPGNPGQERSPKDHPRQFLKSDHLQAALRFFFLGNHNATGSRFAPIKDGGKRKLADLQGNIT